MNKFVLAFLFLTTSAYAYEAPLLLPDAHLTPGIVDINATVDKICIPGYTELVRYVPSSVKRDVFRTYELNPEEDDYEVDHLISLELGGSNDIKNLWPESYTTTPYNARDKDALENRLHKLVCDGKITLIQAQKEIAEDWIKAHQDYIQQH